MTNMFGSTPGQAGPSGLAPAGPQSRYILPSFIEHTPNGMREYNPYAKLFEERIVFLGTPIDETDRKSVV